MELHQLVPVVHFADDRRRQLAIAEAQLRPGVGLAARLRQTFPDALALVPQQQHLHRAACRHAVPQQPRRQHTRIVQHQTVSEPQQLRDLIKMPVSDLARRSVERHQPRRAPVGQRRLRDQLLRQRIIKIMGFQQTLPLFSW